MYTKKIVNIPDFTIDKVKCKEFYQENGFLITEKIFTEAECSKAISESKSFEKFKSNNFIPELMPHRKNEYFLKMMRNVKLVNMINYLMKSDLELFGLQSTFFHGVPGTSGSSAHQDSLYVNPENHDDFISAWVALVDIDIDNMGNLVLYPKSHTLGSLPVIEKDTQNSKHQNDGLVKYESVLNNKRKFNEIKVTVSKGSVVIMHSNLVHKSLDNSSDRNRNSLLLTYIKNNCSFREGFEAKRQRISLTI